MNVPKNIVSLMANKTRGLRVLFITNRNDPKVIKLLKQNFSFAKIDLMVADIRKLNYLKTKLEGSYDVVLLATAFISHKIYWKIRDACVDANVVLIDADKGRPNGCAIGFARDYFGNLYD